MDNYLTCVAVGVVIGCALYHYAFHNWTQHQQTVEYVVQEAGTETAVADQIQEKAVQAAPTEIEYHAKCDCASKYHQDTERHKAEIADARHERDAAKASRDREVMQRLESNRLRRAKEAEVRNAQHNLTQTEARCTIIQDTLARVNLDLKREMEKHAGTRQELNSLRDEHRTAQRDIDRLQAHIRQSIGDSAKDKRIDELQKATTKLTRINRKWKASLDERVKEVNALLADNILGQQTIASLNEKIDECRGSKDVTQKYEAEKNLREAVQTKYDKLETEHKKCSTNLDGVITGLNTAKEEIRSKEQEITTLQGDVKRVTQEKDHAAAAHTTKVERHQREADSKFSVLNQRYQQKVAALSTANSEISRLGKESDDKSSLIADVHRQLNEAKKRQATRSNSTQTDDGADGHPGSDQQTEPMDCESSTQYVESDELPNPPSTSTTSGATFGASATASNADVPPKGSKSSNSNTSTGDLGNASSGTATLTPAEIRAAIPDGGIACQDLYGMFLSRMEGRMQPLYTMIKEVGNIDRDKWVTRK